MRTLRVLILRALGIVGALTVLSVPVAASGQDKTKPAARPPAPSKTASRSRPRLSGWQVDVHAGFLPATPALAGDAGSLPSFPKFNTSNGGTSQFVPSFYFGAGASQLNAAVTSNKLSNTFIVPLDPVLNTASVAPARGRDFGVRIGHSITQYALVEFSFDSVQRKLALSSSALATIEASRASFQAVFQSPLFTVPVTVTSTAAVNDKLGSQRILAGTVSLNGGTFRGITPYVTVGGGLVQNGAAAPSFSLTGNYIFTLSNGGTINHTDAISVTYEPESMAILEVLGGGVRVHLTARSGVRVDMQVQTAKLGGGLKIRVATKPVIVPGSPTSVADRGFGSGTVQFTNSNVPSTLNGSPDDFTTFKSTGAAKTTAVTVGYFFRF